MIELLAATCGGFLIGWISRTLVETRLWFFDDYRRRMGPPQGNYAPRFEPGIVQRGHGHGGPSTPKPKIIPKPQYPGGYISLDGAQPFRVRGRLQPLPDELDAHTYQRGSNPPPPGCKPDPPASPPTFRPDWSPCSQPPNTGGYQPRPYSDTPIYPPDSP